MIKRILVALDSDQDTAVAIRYAEVIAGRYGAQVVGLAVVDTEHIDAEARGGGIGSMYYAAKLRKRMSRETWERAQELIRTFDVALQASGIEHTEMVKEGVPFQRIIEEMKYHDVLLLGNDPHFFYGKPEKQTDTLAQVVKRGSAPTLVVGPEYKEVSRVLIAYDGSVASARTTRSFIQLLPFGSDVTLEVIHVHDGLQAESELMLGLLEKYTISHGLGLRKMSVRGADVADIIVNHAKDVQADLVVAGAHSVSKFREWTLGSTTSELLESVPPPIYLYH